MKRPLSLAMLSYFISLAFLAFAPNSLLIYIVGVIGVLFLIAIFYINKSKVFVISVAMSLAASIVYTINLNINIKPSEQFDGKNVTLKGTVCDLPYKSMQHYYYILKVTSINNKKVRPFKIKLSSSKAMECDPFDDFYGEAYLSIPPVHADFNSKIFQRSKGILLFGKISEHNSVNKITHPDNPPWQYYILTARKEMLSATKKNLPPRLSSFINGVLLGDRNDFPKDVKRNFDISGIYHLLAISGVHISILSTFFFSIFIMLNIKYRYCCILTSICVLIFMGITCFSPSVMRAGIMIILYFISMAFKKNSDSLNSLSTSTGIICLINPNAAYDISLWLSFLATLGILLVYPRINSYLHSALKINHVNKISTSILSPISLSIACSLTTLPLSVLIFKKMSTVFILSNILILIPITALINCALIMNTLTLININSLSFIINPLKIFCAVITNYIIYLSEHIANIPYALIPMNYGFIYLWISFSLILLVICILFSKTSFCYKLSIMLSINLLLTGIVYYQFYDLSITRLSVKECGDGISIIIDRNNHKSLILAYFDKTNIESATKDLYTPYNHNFDYANLIPEENVENEDVLNVLKTFNPKTIACYKNNSEFNYFKNIVYYKEYLKSHFWDDSSLKIKKIHNSVYGLLKIQKISILIIPKSGDIDSIPASWRNCDFLISCGLPINFQNGSFKNIIISSSKSTAELCIPKALKYYKNVYSISHQGSLNIDINKSSCNYKIRRLR